MNCIWNFMISWLLWRFLIHAIPVQSYRNEVTFPISSASITLQCDNDLRVNNIDVAIRQRNTTCSTPTADCTLPNDAIVTIKDKCNKQASCDVDIRSFTNNQSCLHEYGYFNVWYKCKTIIDYSCDFESDLCNWTFVQPNDRFQWKRGLRTAPRKPTIDHTSASTEGKYAYILAYRSEENDFAKLESGYIVGTDQQCLSFWYYTTNSRDSVNVYQNKTNLYSLSGYAEQRWHHIHISLLNLTSLYKLVFKVVRGKKLSGNGYGAIVIDDILIENKHCNRSLFDCDFETDSDICTGILEYEDDWIIQKGDSLSNNKGPKYDHSTASGSGYFIYLNIDTKTEDTTVYVEFPNVEITILVNSCFSFWYYMYGNEKGRLDVIIHDYDDEPIWTKVADRKDKWQKGLINLNKGDLTNIKFIGIIGTGWEGDIAIDDFYITDGTCEGLIDYEELCVNLEEGISKETVCSRGYFDLKNPHLSFDPEKEECSETYNEPKLRILQECRDRDDSQKCLIDLSFDISSYPECFQVYEFRILHTCEENKTTTILSDTTSGRYSSAEEETTTVLSDTTAGGDQSTVSDESVNLPRAMRTPSEPATGLIVGLVIGALLLICVVVLIVVLMRRHTFKSKPREKIRNKIGENDYIGSQDIALSCLPLAANHSKHMQNTGIYNEGSDTSLHGHDSTNANAHINNVQHEYTNVGAIKGFVNQKKDQVPKNTHRQDKTIADNPMLNDDEYAIVDPIFETRCNETTENRTGTSDSYMVLDPNQTGFNRQVSNTPVGYDFAKPVSNTENKIGNDDHYSISQEGVYDHSGNNRYKESENNIYNHAVDTIYDSGSHKRNEEGREDTYDHFSGQTTEDDYNISTTT